MAIRVTPKPYNNAILLEINAHSLFSKYFSESGKLVMKMFSRIKEYLEDLNTFVVILIDEVESLTAARSGMVPSNFRMLVAKIDVTSINITVFS